jgi:hypothetical protein
MTIAISSRDLLEMMSQARRSYEQTQAILATLVYQPCEARGLDGLEAQIEDLAADADRLLVELRAILAERRDELSTLGARELSRTGAVERSAQTAVYNQAV